MSIIHQAAQVIPYGEALLNKAEGVYDYSKGQGARVLQLTENKFQSTKKGYLDFRGNVEKTVTSIAQETVNEVLIRFENFLGVQSDKVKPEDLKKLRERVQLIFQTAFREYVLKSRLITNKQSQALIRIGKQYSINYLVPLYISIKATLIVTKEMLLQFLENRLQGMKLTYQSSKDNVVMFVSGNFNEEKLKEKVFEGIDSFKKFTVRVVNRGLEIRVDRQSLMENYDNFAVNFLEAIKEVREKGEGNINDIKNKSRGLYKQVVNRIRAKQLEIRTELRTEKTQLVSEAL